MPLKMTSKRKQGFRHLSEYFQQTTLHGWSYIVNEEGILAKVLWVIAQIGFVTFAVYLMTSNVKFLSYSQQKLLVFSKKTFDNSLTQKTDVIQGYKTNSYS